MMNHFKKKNHMRSMATLVLTYSSRFLQFAYNERVNGLITNIYVNVFFGIVTIHYKCYITLLLQHSVSAKESLILF